MTNKQPHPTTIAVGENIKNLRMLGKNGKRVSQETLAEHLGISFPQLQKNENGTNRNHDARLLEIAKFFGVPVSALFDGLEGEAKLPCLTPNESNLLDMYRSLTKKNQVFIYTMLKNVKEK